MRSALSVALFLPLLAHAATAQSADDPIVGTTIVDFESGAAGWVGPSGPAVPPRSS